MRGDDVKGGIALTLVLILTGCGSAPDYHPPEISVPAAFKEAEGWKPAGTAVVPAGRWWEAFGDAVLSGLEESIEGDNPGLAAAAARYAQAQALLRQAQADRLPSVDVAAAAARQRVPGRGGDTYASTSLGASLSYEIDLFGRVASSVAAGRAGAEASEADLAAVRLGLQAQLAAAYFDLRGLDARIALLSETAGAYRRAYDLTSTRHEGGIASGIDVSRAESQLAAARAELQAVSIARRRDEHAIAVLTGQPPAGFTIAPVAGGAQPPPPAIPAGLPSTLVERRPDIRAAERRVAEANARIGVARAALFPSLTLGAGSGFDAAGGPAIGASAAFWALGPLTAAATLFDGGRRKAGVALARAEHQEAAAAYRSTVLAAFREVEDDLAAVRGLAAQEAEQARAAAAAGRTRDLALIRYHDGAADYLEVVTAQTAALDAERASLAVRTDRLRTAVDLVRALGGSF